MLSSPPSSDQTSFECLKHLTIGETSYSYHSLSAAEENIGSLEKLPFCIRIFLENVLQHRKDQNTSLEDIQSLCTFHAIKKRPPPLSFIPSQLVLCENVAVSVLTDMASLQNEIERQSSTPLGLALGAKLDIVTDRSKLPLSASKERLRLLRWSQKRHEQIRLVPPEKGALEAIALHYLCDIVHIAPPFLDTPPHLSSDILLGTDPSVTALGALGCLTCRGDVLDIETILLDGALKVRIPSVIGIRLEREPHPDTSIMDIGLTLLAALLKENLRGSFVEFYGPGLDSLSIPDRAIIASLLGQTDALGIFFPLDNTVIRYMTRIGKKASTIALIKHYAQEQGLWRESGNENEQSHVIYSQQLVFSLDKPRPCLARLENSKTVTALPDIASYLEEKIPKSIAFSPLDDFRFGDVVLAEISTVSSLHLEGLLLAGLAAKKAHEKGLTLKPWVCGRIRLGAPHIKEFLQATGCYKALEAIGFSFNDKEFSEKSIKALRNEKIKLAVIRSGPERRQEEANAYTVQASPLLVVAYGLAGNLAHDFTTKPLDPTAKNAPCFLKDIWPSHPELEETLTGLSFPTIYHKNQAALFDSVPEWDALLTKQNEASFDWKEGSAYVQHQPLVILPPIKQRTRDMHQAQILAIYGDHVRADALVPHGPIEPLSSAGRYLQELGVPADALGSYEDYTGNHEVILRGAFKDKGLLNKLVPHAPQGETIFVETGLYLPFFDVAKRYANNKTPLLIAGGQNFGCGTGTDWGAKVIALMGIKAILADSFAPAFRRALVRVGVLPLSMKQGAEIASLNITPSDQINIIGFDQTDLLPMEVLITFEQKDNISRYMVVCNIRYERELDMMKKGNIWNAYEVSKI